ncbi:hypothetical protein A1O1_07533 [Capronia coronata CBS 617.96]|uniref:Uncharacterized protein n=1 Tax=Capronia coronata CBS 617.96 TaxID=1182541 RepID=W9YNS5_9EURO|nr:uncharacterized protein A1O1_07533 [Capronia coronata CBS 617.96]EXJ83904.1 hypothetical protein A1O1_07533 [Capronia coronata CBS 617.96]
MSPTKLTSATSADSVSNTNPLTERSPNTASPSKPKASDKITTSAMDGKQMPRFDHTAQKYPVASASASAGQGQGQSQNQTYISPSDAMQSPTTKKLSEIKGRRFMNAKPQTLFAKTLNQNHASLNFQARDLK